MVKTDPCGDVVWNGCEPVGIGDIDMKLKEIVVYPNPTQDILFFDGDHLSPKTGVVVIDQLGKTVLNEILGTDYMIDLSHLNEGLFNIVLINNGSLIFSESVIRLRSTKF